MGPLLNRGVMHYTSSNAFTCMHGNSLVAGVGASGSSAYVGNQLVTLPPLTVLSSFHHNDGNPGYTYAQLQANSADIDTYMFTGKTNILWVWEGTNTLQAKGGAAAFADCKTYSLARRAANPKRVIVHLTCLPFRLNGDSDATTNARMAELAIFNKLLKDNIKDIGGDYVCDVLQPGSPWAGMPDYSASTFAAIRDKNGVDVWWSADSAGKVHLSDAGYAAVAQMMAATARRIAPRIA